MVEVIQMSIDVVQDSKRSMHLAPHVRAVHVVHGFSRPDLRLSLDNNVLGNRIFSVPVQIVFPFSSLSECFGCLVVVAFFGLPGVT